MKLKDHMKSTDEGSKTLKLGCMQLDRPISKWCRCVPLLKDPLQNIVFPGNNGPVAAINTHVLKATQGEEHSGETSLGYYKNESSEQ